MTLREQRVAAVQECGAVAVLRLPRADDALRAVDALLAGGVRAIEVTLTTPGALDILSQLHARRDPQLVVGAGSVLHADDARRAIDAGATYVVCPVISEHVLRIAHDADVPAMLGAFTPTEMFVAHECGADIIKVFPADTLGPAYLRAVLAPMPFLRLMPTGGVTPANIGQWLAAGAVAVGLGSALLDPALVARAAYNEITERARAVSAAVRAVRSA